MRTLEWMVRQDISEEKFKLLKTESISDKVFKSINTGEKMTGSHYDVAEVVCDFYQNEFICSGLKENMWYYFNEKKGGKWEMTEMGHELRKKLSGEIVEIYMYYQNKFHTASQNTTGAEQNNNNIYFQNCSKISMFWR